MNKIGDTDDVAFAVLYLASDESKLYWFRNRSGWWFERYVVTRTNRSSAQIEYW